MVTALVPRSHYPRYERRRLSLAPDWVQFSGPPQWYPTHSNAYYVGVTGFTEVSCMGIRSLTEWLKPENNRYDKPDKPGTVTCFFHLSRAI